MRRVALPDGSMALIETITLGKSVLISREEDGEVVWGQAFAHDTDLDGVVTRVLTGMTRNPDGYLSAPYRGVYCSEARGCHPNCRIRGMHGW